MSRELAQTYIRELLGDAIDPTAVMTQEFSDTLDKLIALGDDAIEPIIEEILKYNDSDYQYYQDFEIALALGDLGDKAIDRLIDTLDIAENEVRTNVLRILGSIRNEKALPRLLHEFWEKQALGSIEALRRFGSKECHDALRKALSDDRFDNRAILRSWTDPKISDVRLLPHTYDVEKITTNLKTKGIKKISALRQIMRRRDTRFIDETYEIMTSESHLIICQTAAVTLADLDIKFQDKAYEVLQHALDTEQHHFYVNLRYVNNSELLEFFLPLLQSPKARARSNISGVFSKTEFTDALPNLKQCLEIEPHRIVRRRIHNAIRHLEDEDP